MFLSSGNGIKILKSKPLVLTNAKRLPTEATELYRSFNHKVH